jgi:hypothetical protein
MIRNEFGQPIQITGVQQGATPYDLVFQLPIPIPIYSITDSVEASLIALGTVSTVVTDWTVVAMNPRDSARVEITAVVYNPLVYNDAMPHQKVDDTADPIGP